LLTPRVLLIISQKLGERGREVEKGDGALQMTE
jgi:hypothetical protein